VTRRRVVLVLPDPPLPFGNAGARWFYVLVRDLPARGYDLTTFAACRSADEHAKVTALLPPDRFDVRLYPPPQRGAIRSKWETLRRPHAHMFSDDLRRDLAAALNKRPDVLHLEQLWTGWLGLPYAARAVLNVHYLFEVDLATAPAAATERLRRLNAWVGTRRLLRRFSHITTVAPRLTRQVARLVPDACVTTVPFGLDVGNYPFEPRGHPGATPVVALIGSFEWYPTLAAAERLLTRLWPEIARRLPTARLALVGRNAGPALRRWAGMPNVTVHENVPDILPHFRTADLLLYPAPSTSGIKVKVLEAFAMGVPVVTTPDGVEGLPAQDGVHAGITLDDVGLVKRAIQLLTDVDRWRRTRQAARRLVEAHCCPERVLGEWERVYDRIASGAF
jgi:polysaccharide biosynthesis protein PslH